MAPKGSKTKTLRVQEKIEICQRLENGECPYSLANEFGVSVFTCRRIRREATTLQHYAEQGSHMLNRKNRRKPKYEAIEKRLYEWFLERKAAGDCLLTNSMFQKRALEIKQELGGFPTFNVSRGWVTKFRDRHNIRSLRLLDDDTSTDEETLETLNLWPIEFLDNITETVEEGATRCHSNNDTDEMIVTWVVVPSKRQKVQECEQPPIQHQLENSIELPIYEEVHIPKVEQEEEQIQLKHNEIHTPTEEQEEEQMQLKHNEIHTRMEEQEEEQMKLKHNEIHTPMEKQEEEQVQPKHREIHIPLEERNEGQIQPEHKEIHIPLEEEKEGQIQPKHKEIHVPLEKQEEEQIQPKHKEVYVPMEEQEEKQIKVKYEEIDVSIEGEEQQGQEQGILKHEREEQEESVESIKMKELEEALKIIEKYAPDKTTLAVAQCLINEILQDT